MSEMLTWLKDYIAVTPKEQIEKDWNEIKAMGFDSPLVGHYIPYAKANAEPIEPETPQ
jgi:hypothetical protein